MPPPSRGHLLSAKNLKTGTKENPFESESPKTKKLKPFNYSLSFIMDHYLDSQKIGLKTQSETDVELILQDGMIPCHAVMLQAASPFFEQMFKTQGPYFPETRKILMPDFSVQIMMKVIQLIYDQEVVLRSKGEAKEVENVIKLLKICENQKLDLTSTTPRREPRQVVYLITNCMQEQKFEMQFLPNDEKHIKDDDEATEVITSQKSSANSAPAPTRSLRVRSVQTKNKLKHDSDGDVSEDDLPSPSSSSANSDDEDKYVRAKMKARRNQKKTTTTGKNSEINDCLTALNLLTNNKGVGTTKGTSVSSRDGSSSNKAVPSPSSTSSKSSKGNVPPPTSAKTQQPIKKVVLTSNKSNDPGASSNEEESESMSGDSDSDGRHVKKLEHFQAEAKRCQKCNKTYGTPAEASKCLNEHKLVRCYFCFKIYGNTEKLFSHFENRHRKAGRDKFLMCPYCDQSIPFKSVSCHVISTHLTDAKPKIPASTGPTPTSGGGSRPSVASTGLGVGRPGRPSYHNSSNTTTVTINNNNDKTKYSPGSSTSGEPPSKRLKPTTSAKITEPSVAEPKKKDQVCELKVGGLEATIRQKSGRHPGKTWVFTLRKSRP